jgi:hypothetical protein
MMTMATRLRTGRRWAARALAAFTVLVPLGAIGTSVANAVTMEQSRVVALAEAPGPRLSVTLSN